MLVMLNGGAKAAKQRLSRKGWAQMEITVGPAKFDAMGKGGAMVVFHPDGDFSSVPGTMPGFVFQPLSREEALYDETMDCLCGTLL